MITSSECHLTKLSSVLRLLCLIPGSAGSEYFKTFPGPETCCEGGALT